MGAVEFEFITHPNPIARETREAIVADGLFGRAFTDHMVSIRWDRGRGWQDAKVRPYGPFQIDPANAVLHYAQEIFEGMKAYRAPDGEVYLFRPGMNARRFNASARRMAMPELPEGLFIASVEHLVRADADWIPSGEGSLYLRPFMFADEAFLGVRPADRFTYCVIASPAGAYFKGGNAAISIWVSTRFSRSAAGGTGDAKCGGNYAGSLAAQAEASENGCDQVLFLDSKEGRWVEELGGMNIFFIERGSTLRTPPLGTILPGITRASIIEMAHRYGLQVDESPITFDELYERAVDGTLTEVFVCGTAAAIVPVGNIRSATRSFTVGDGAAGALTERIRSDLVAIQRGGQDDSLGWRHRVRR